MDPWAIYTPGLAPAVMGGVIAYDFMREGAAVYKVRCEGA